MTLIQGIDSWLDIFKKDTIKPSSYDRLLRSRNLLSNDEISLMELNDISKKDIQLYLSRLNVGGYAQNTIKKQLTLLTAYFKHALSEGDMVKPVYLGVRLPKTRYAQLHSDKPKSYSEEEQRLLINRLMALEHPVDGALICMLECGLRIGEALGLTWDDYDVERRAIRISKTLIRVQAGGSVSFVQRGAKSASSNRIVPLSPVAQAVLNQLLQEENDIQGSMYIFHAPEAPYEPLTYSCAVHHLQKACRESGVAYYGTHILRHTFATNCYHKGCDVKILSKLLGHADTNITYNTYIHLYGDALEEMRKIVDPT